MPPTTTTKYPDIIDLLKLQYSTGQLLIARETEKAIINESKKLPRFSCNTADILKQWITLDPSMMLLKEKVMKLQCEPDPVLIVGESGTGKEMIARALHGGRTGKFISINCTSLPDTLIESELFGHKKGAFTGAMEDRPGKFEAAWKGTLFLDEIGDMPLNMQSKLLRVLQERRLTPVGSNVEQEVDCRVICATNRNIQELLNKEHFRSDLFYRLSTFILKTSPLRERLCDIEHLVDSFGGETLIDEFEKWKKTQTYSESEGYEKFFSMEGNVRSLQAQVRNWIVLGEY